MRRRGSVTPRRRHGSRWRHWDRTDASRSTGTTTLEDAAIVRELIATGRAL